MLTHALDLATANPTADWEEEVTRHYNFVISSNNFIFNNGKDSWTAEDIRKALSLYQVNLIPTFKEFIDPEKHWILYGTADLWLNVSDSIVVKNIYSRLKEFLSKRNTKDEIALFKLTELSYFRFLSYANRKLLLTLLEQEPFKLVSYNGSKDIYNTIIAICHDTGKTSELEEAKKYEYKNIDVTNNGVVLS